MADDDWSDSDDGNVETAVLLGVADGPIESAIDLTDAAVSRIGGHPAFLSSRPPEISCSSCKNCSTPMELLVQIWCPVEDSPHDRALYVWACAKGSCQKKAGSIRAWRGLRHNEQYATKLNKIAMYKTAENTRAAKEEEKKLATKSNPFTMQSSASPNPFGLGSQIFGGAAPVEIENSSDGGGVAADEDRAESEAAASSASEGSLIIAMTTIALEETPWVSSPTYPPLYLSTTSEYVPPPPKSKLPAGVLVEDYDESKDAKGTNWAAETWENSLEVDFVFERFTKRVGYEGEQCIRYELKGVPLPFASDKVFDAIFPVPPAIPLPVTKPDFKVVPAQKRTYDPSSLSVCPICNSKRVFECQLMPNLINILRPRETGSEKMTDEERRKAVEIALKGGDNADNGMEWGTCMIFSCEKDCCTDDKGEFEAKECWREELVLVQWDE